jgi:hypothetical protein
MYMSREFPLRKYMLDTFMEAVGRGEVQNSNMKVVMTREIYRSRMASLLTPPKAENKFPLVNFPNILYPRMTHAGGEAEGRDVLSDPRHLQEQGEALPAEQGRQCKPSMQK